GAFVPEHGAQIWAAIQAYRAVVFEDARASGVKAAYDAYTADALLNMAKDARDGVLCEHPEADPGPPMDSGGAEPAGDLHRRGPGGASRRQCGVGDAPGAQNGPGAGKSGYDGPRDDGLGDDRPRDDGLRDDGPRDDGRRDDKPRDDKPRDDKPPDEKSERKKRRPPPVSIDILVDYNALVRGKALPDETCEIDGIGPVPVDTVAALQNDAYLWVLVKDGCDIKSVSRMGRYISPRLRKALIARDRKCVVPGCDVRAHLQIDHIRPVADQGPTALDNLALLCVHHHMLKTHHGFVLAGKPGDWSWNGPGGPASGKG
ncbi:MAG: HNH endonuclease, partial [Actinomycetota bacterium]